MNSIVDIEDMASIEGRDTSSPGVERTLHPLRGAILRALSSAGSPVSFKGISARTRITPSLCAYHLRLLGERGLVKRTFDHGEGRKEFSYYSITRSGTEAVWIEDLLIHGPARTAERPPGKIYIVSWSNMPRCLIVGGG